MGEDIEKMAEEAKEPLEYCRKIGTGEVLTTSAVLRAFVRSHSTYKNDSILTEECLSDLRIFMHRITIGEIEPFE